MWANNQEGLQSIPQIPALKAPWNIAQGNALGSKLKHVAP
jgi:hypothetical protein